MAFSFLPSKNTKGFTLIELIIVVAIMGLLTAFIAFISSVLIDRAKVAKAQGDLNRIAKAIRQLEVDTGLMPNKEPSTTCTKTGGIVTGAGNSIYFSPGHASVNRSGMFANFADEGGGTGPAVTTWKGPYLDGDINQLGLDPWGTPYEYDGDYVCEAGVKGCERYIGTLDNDRALVSWGKDKTVYTADDIAVVFCGAP